MARESGTNNGGDPTAGILGGPTFVVSLGQSANGDHYVVVSMVNGMLTSTVGIDVREADTVADELAKRIKEAGREGRRKARGFVTPGDGKTLVVPR